MNKFQGIIIWATSILLAGCASLQNAQISNKYAAIYNDALNRGTNITIVKEGNFEEVRDRVNEHFKSLGYTKVVYSSPEQAFTVATKNTSVGKALLIGDVHPCQIMFKYTKAGPGKTRIDLVRGSSILITNSEVNKDLREIARLIEND